MPEFTPYSLPPIFGFTADLLTVFVIGVIFASITVFVARWAVGWPKTRKSAWFVFAIVSLLQVLFRPVTVILVATFCIMVADRGLKIARGTPAWGAPAGRVRIETTCEPRKRFIIIAALLDLLGVASLFLLYRTGALAIEDINGFYMFFGHALLYLFPVLIPLYIASICLTLRLLIRIITGIKTSTA